MHRELRSKARCRAQGNGRPAKQAHLSPSGPARPQTQPQILKLRLPFLKDLPGEPHPHGDDLDSGGLWRSLLESFRSMV